MRKVIVVPINHYRVLRSGSWISFGRVCRSGNRFGYVPGTRIQDYGFRLAAVPCRDK